MENKIEELSVFFPFWNEEENVSYVVENAIPVLKRCASKWEILIIDDGSADRTYQEGLKLAEKYKNIRVISHKPNRGYGAALKEGFQNSLYDIIVFTDGDRQFNFAEIAQFIKEIKSSDIVIGFRKRRRDNIVRHILMNLLKLWDFIFFRFYFKDIDCGFKMFKKEALEKIGPLRSEGAMITTEILAKATRKKLKIREVEVNHYPREFGDQSGANLAVVIRAILESFILWFDILNKRI